MTDENFALWAARRVQRIVKREERFGDAHPATIHEIERVVELFEEEIRPLMREVDEQAAGDINHDQLRRIVTAHLEMRRVHDAHPHPVLKSALDEIKAWITT